MLLISLYSLGIEACKFYVYNDGDRPIWVYEGTRVQLFRINPRRKKLIGDPVKHADCSIFYESNENPIVQFRMVACATPGQDTDVVMSKLMQGEVPSIFELVQTAYKPSAKPAGGCSTCQAKHTK